MVRVYLALPCLAPLSVPCLYPVAPQRVFRLHFFCFVFYCIFLSCFSSHILPHIHTIHGYISTCAVACNMLPPVILTAVVWHLTSLWVGEWDFSIVFASRTVVHLTRNGDKVKTSSHEYSPQALHPQQLSTLYSGFRRALTMLIAKLRTWVGKTLFLFLLLYDFDCCQMLSLQCFFISYCIHCFHKQVRWRLIAILRAVNSVCGSVVHSPC